MAGEIFKLFGSIGLKTEEAEKGMKGVIGEAETTGNTLTSIFKKAAVAIGTMFAAKKLIDFGSIAVSAAAEAEEFAGAFEQVFKGFESQAEASMQNVTDTIKASEGRFKESFLQISGFGKASGMDTAESIDLSNRAIIAAADYAAMYGGTLEDTSGSLQSFLKGNYANDAALGVSATEFTRNAKAVELYGVEFNELTETQKQWTLLGMVEEANEQSGALGQAAREVDSYANTMGELKNAWNEFLIIVGGPILKAVVPVIKSITQGVQWLTEAIVPAAEAVGKFFEGFKSSSGEIRKVISREFKQLMQWFDGFVSIFKEIDFELLLENLIEFGQGAIEVFMEIAEGVLEFLEPIQTYWENTIETIQTLFRGLVRAFNQAMRGDWSGAFDTLKTAIGGALTDMADNIIEAWSGIWDNVKEFASSIDWMGVGQTIMSTLGNAISGAIGFLGDIGAIIKSWISEKLGLGADGSWSDIGNKVLENIKAGIGAAKDTVGGIAEAIRGWIVDKLGLEDGASWVEIGTTILGHIVEAVGNAGEKFGEFVTNLITGINGAMTAEQFNEMVNNFLSFVATAVGGAAVALLSIALALISGIGLGLTGADNWSEVGDAIVNGIKDYLRGVVINLQELFTFTGEPKFNTDGFGGDVSPSANPNKSKTPGGNTSDGFGIGAGGYGKIVPPSIDTSVIDTLIAEVTAKINAAVASIEELGRNYTAKLIDGMTKGITTNQSKVILNLGILGNNMKTELDKIHEKANQAVESGMNKVQVAYRSGLLKAYATVRDNLARITEAFRSQIGAVTKAGEDTGRGFYNGLASQRGRIISLANDIARSVLTTMTRALDINSPSGETEWIADMTIDGLVNNLKNGIQRVKDATSQVANAMLFDPQDIDFGYTNNQATSAAPSLMEIMLDEVTRLLKQLLDKDDALYMDGYELARRGTKYINQENELRVARNTRLKGGSGFA